MHDYKQFKLIKTNLSSLIFVLSSEVKCIVFFYDCILFFFTLMIFVNNINDIEKKKKKDLVQSFRDRSSLLRQGRERATADKPKRPKL